MHHKHKSRYDTAPLSEAAGVHWLVHCLLAEGMVCAHVFHVIEMREAVLIAWLPVIARGTRVPILHIKFAQKTHILIGKYLYDVGEAGCQLLNRWLYTSRDVWDDANAVNMRDGGGGA